MGKRISANTIIWKTFEKIFIGMREDQFPFNYVPGLTFGQAINLAQGLNKCQVQWEQENGIPEGFNTRSAKAKLHTTRAPGEPVDYSAPAYVEISLSPKRTGQRGNSALRDILTSGLDTIPEPEPWSPSVQEDIPPPARPDSQDELLTKWYKPGKE